METKRVHRSRVLRIVRPFVSEETLLETLRRDLRVRDWSEFGYSCWQTINLARTIKVRQTENLDYFEITFETNGEKQ